jgi:SAM-dependent methyltransferase
LTRYGSLRRLIPAAARTRLRRIQGWGLASGVARRQGRQSVVLPPIAFWPLLRLLVRNAESVLDIGCGHMHTLSQFDARVRVGVDAHRPYLEHRVRNSSLVPVHYDARRLSEIFLPQSFSLVTMIDVIEHFEKHEAYELLQLVERLAKQRCVIFTPRGYFPQEDFDAYGLGGEEFQRHRSSWQPEEFAGLGYSTAVLIGLHQASNNVSHRRAFGEAGAPVDAILAWKDLASR